MMDLESVFNEIKAMSQEQFDALMEEVRAMSEPPYDETVNEEPAVAPMNQADISENSRYKELKVNPCAYGVHFSAVMDDEDGSIVVFGEGGWATSTTRWARQTGSSRTSASRVYSGIGRRARNVDRKNGSSTISTHGI